MSDYQRITSYLYEYNNGIRGENIGFIRVETKDHQLKISFTLNTSKLLSPIRLYFYYYEHGKMIGIPWDEINQTTRRFEYKESFHIDEVFRYSKTLTDMDGILFYYDDQQFYGSQWNETPINIHVFQQTKESENDREPQLEEYMEALSLHEQPEEKQPAPVKRTKKSYPSMDPYPTPDYSSCIKIQPDDFSDFPFLPQELNGNGFLKMQFQNYGHLFLGQKKLTDCYYIGVPGIFTNQRNFVAHLFGFPEFIPVPLKEQKTGNFGYWVMTINH